jgi:antitoxin HigA-1
LSEAHAVDFEQYHWEKLMPLYKARRDNKRPPLHPGKVIADILLDFSVSKSEIAARLGISRQHLNSVLEGKKPMSPVMAAKVGALLGGGTELWLRIQASYEAWAAAASTDISGIKPLQAA